ncbi:MFS transporter [Caulobacter sp. S45]|uniref:MFS transporter n=1 Tax=Caulobacter sp. S45 TaxID=1641861 RepID=UPI00131D003C|nr:MFS transporter [Caulobacter sp. S45]
MATDVVDITKLVNEQKLGWLCVQVIGLTFLVMLSDGYDLSATTYAADGVMHALKIKHAAMGVVFSMGLFGMLFGAPAFGFLGDRFGRKRAIIAASLIYGVFSLACSHITALWQLEAFRFMVGVGLGGLLPNVTALNQEFSPRRLRATFTVLTFLGLTFGGLAPALISTVVPPQQWRMLFVIGGAAPILIAPALILWLPESIKFMALRGGHEAKIRRLVTRLKPGLEPPIGATFIVEETNARRGSAADLFKGGRQVVTPLLWVAFAAALMVNFFLNSWMPTLMREAGLSAGRAALVASMYYFGGIAGGLSIGRVLDRFGRIGLVAFFALAIPVVAAIGTPHLSQPVLMALVFLSGYAVLGSQLGLSASAGMIYPTAIRSNGAGWAHGVGRLGAIAGPMVAAQLLAAHLSLRELLLVPAAPLSVGALATLGIALFHRDPKEDGQPAEKPTTEAIGPVMLSAS